MDPGQWPAEVRCPDATGPPSSSVARAVPSTLCGDRRRGRLCLTGPSTAARHHRLVLAPSSPRPLGRPADAGGPRLGKGDRRLCRRPHQLDAVVDYWDAASHKLASQMRLGRTFHKVSRMILDDHLAFNEAMASARTQPPNGQVAVDDPQLMWLGALRLPREG